MVHYRNSIILAAVVFTLIVFLPSAQAEPPLKEGNPGLPGCLATVNQLEQIIEALQNYAPVTKTGKTLSYVPGDDGDLQIGLPWRDPRFTDNTDGTVKDNLTGLIWTKNANLYGYTYSLSDALTFCSSCDEGGYTDWRLPNVRELQSIIDYGALERPLLPAGHPFTGPVGAGDHWYYWSSTSQGVTSAYCISFENGFMWSLSGGNVWCVRGPVPFHE